MVPGINQRYVSLTYTNMLAVFIQQLIFPNTDTFMPRLSSIFCRQTTSVELSSIRRLLIGSYHTPISSSTENVSVWSKFWVARAWQLIDISALLKCPYILNSGRLVLFTRSGRSLMNWWNSRTVDLNADSSFTLIGDVMWSDTASKISICTVSTSTGTVSQKHAVYTGTGHGCESNKITRTLNKNNKCIPTHTGQDDKTLQTVWECCIATNNGTLCQIQVTLVTTAPSAKYKWHRWQTQINIVITLRHLHTM